ncbi:MAG: hypothetical protein NTW28_05575 [Candidatus Solibacter sp.]|nr:hypothetical protein [Candidatus Solibacter sp.]
MTSQQAIQGLGRAVASRDSAVMLAALPLVPVTEGGNEGHRAIVLRFLNAIAHTASLAGADAGVLGAALRHAGEFGGLGAAERMGLVDIQRTLLGNALREGLGEIAFAVASAAAGCTALGDTDRVLLVATWLKQGRLDRRAAGLLARFDAVPSLTSLLRVLQQKFADLDAAATSDAGGLRAVAEWALAKDAKAVWAQKAVAVACARSAEFDGVLTALAGLETDEEARALCAWALAGNGRFAEAGDGGPAAGARSGLVRAIRLLIPLVRAFGMHAPPAAIAPATSAAGVAELMEAGDMIAALGPTAQFAAGASLAQAGRMSEAIEYCRRAVQQAPDARRCYGLAHLMQLSGWWDAAGSVLNLAPADSPALDCLRLAQLCHEEGSLDGPSADSDPLVRARHALLTGSSYDYLEVAEGDSRETAEEALRINLALAVRARDQERLTPLMGEPLFALLPAAETEFYAGARCWLAGDAVGARSKLRRSAEMAPEYLPALRCLAAATAALGDHQEAGALWDKVTKLAPGEGSAFVHRALEFTAAGDLAKGTASLRGYCARASSDDQANYFLARLQLATAFERAEGALDGDWDAVGRTAGLAATGLERLKRIPEASWFGWAGRVIQEPPGRWRSRLQSLLAAEPVRAAAPPPVEAQWLGGLLRVMGGDFEAAMGGLRALAAAAPPSPAPAAIGQLEAACWRVALMAGTAERATDVVALVLPLSVRFPQLSATVDFLDARFGSGLKTAGTAAGKQAATVGHIRGLLAAGAQAELAPVLDELRTGGTEPRRMLAAVVALELRSFAVFAELAGGATPDERWELLRAIALAKQGHKDSVTAFCALLERAAAGRNAWPAQPALAGMLALLGVKLRMQVRERVNRVLAALPAAALGDPDIALFFLRTSTLIGQAPRAVGVLRSHPAGMTREVRRELWLGRCLEACQAIQAGTFPLAADLIEKVAGEPEAEPSAEMEAVRQRTRRLATVAALLEALSPHPALRADVARFAALAGFLPFLGDTALRRSSTPTARGLLRNRLGEYRRNQAAEQWHPAFRALAILHWEWGLAAMKLDPTLTEESIECFRFAHFLWRHLLTHERCWTNFAAASGLAGDETAAVRKVIEAEILDVHREQAHLFLTASDAEGCRFHLSCLQRWARPAALQFLTPESVISRPLEGFSPDAAGTLDAQAASAFEAWVDGVLWRARTLRDDPAARPNLPPGIDRDYDAAIGLAGEALEVVPDQHRLCVFVLEQHVDCAYALYAGKQVEDASERVRMAVPLARQVANDKFRGRHLTGPDGDLLRRVFDYAYKLETDDELRVPLVREYLQWNGPDAEAERSLQVSEERLAQARRQDFWTG